MKIAFITPSMKLGGYERVVLSYANELSIRGHSIDILCGTKYGELLTLVSPQVHVIDFHARARKFLLPLVKYLRNEKVDILYCGFREYNCIGIIAKMIARSDVCIYATQHGFQKKGFLLNFLEGRIINYANVLVAVANEIADFEARTLNIDRKRFVIFNNPVLDLTKPICDEEHPWFSEISQIPIIVVSGRLAEDKGKKYCIDILNEIEKTKKTRMLFLGDGPCLQEVRNMVTEYGLNDYVDFKGYVSNPLGYMKKCSLFLHTALEEGFGNVIVEALYCNLPVCVTNCSGPMQIIENGKYGMNLGSVYDKEFVNHAAEKILQVINGQVSYDGLIKRAECYGIQNSTDQFLQSYVSYHK